MTNRAPRPNPAPPRPRAGYQNRAPRPRPYGRGAGAGFGLTRSRTSQNNITGARLSTAWLRPVSGSYPDHNREEQPMSNYSNFNLTPALPGHDYLALVQWRAGKCTVSPIKEN